MATSKLLMLALLALPAAARSREAASPSACQAAAAQPTIANAKAALDLKPNDLRANFKLADAWSDAGCFSDALQVLQTAAAQHSGNKELETRLRVAKSLVGEEHFFDNIDRANDEAKFKRDIFRCSTLSDLEACSEAVRMKSDDPAVLVAQGDALAREKKPLDALARYRRAAALAPNQPDIAAKIAAIESQLPPVPPQVAALPGSATDPRRAAVAPMRHRAAVREVRAAREAKAAPEVRVASADARPTRRYSNAAPDAQSH